MSLFGSSPKASSQTIASGVTIQSSCYGGVVPVIYGRTRLTGNLIWYGDFQSIAVKSSSGGGGKGGGGGTSGGKDGGTTSTDYKASFIFALGEGELVDCQNVWSSKSKTAFSASGISFAGGPLSQPPWGYLTTKYPDQALSYAGTGYAYAAAYDLGNSAQLPNLSYEITGLFANAISSLPDADPKDIVSDILTNARYGVGFPSARLGDLSVFSGYCRAAGLVMSPVFDTQTDAASQLNDIVQDCNCEFVWSGTTLTIVPYGDQDLSANGATYTAPSAPLYSLADDDFLDTGSGDPVQCSRKRPSDQMNSVKLEWSNRANDYNVEIVEAKNQAAIEAYGLRADQPKQSHEFCDLSAATMSATLQLQRQAVRNVYSFTLGWRYCLLDPMDIVEISDTGLGLVDQWVRILSLEEDDTGNIKVTAEEYLGGTGHAPLYSYESGSPFIADFNVAPGPVNAPLIFEPSPTMLAANSIAAPQIMVGASGGANWGGCDVWLSLDGSTYKRMGRITAPARQGSLTNTLASAADPDTTHTLSVDLGESRGALLSGTEADADAFRTLCYVDGELIAYETATLNGASQYGLTYLRRGVFGTTIAAHAAGTEFCRLDDSVVSFDLPVTPVSYVGQTLYLKFLSFNIYGGGQEQLADVSAYTYNPNGAAIFVYPPSGVSFTVGAEQQKDGSWLSYGVVSWTASPDPLFDQYEVQYRLHTGPGPWISWRGGPGTTSFRISPLPTNTAYDVQVRAVRSSGPFYSAWAQNLNVTTVGKTAAPPAPTSPSCSGGYRQITLDWVASAENDIAWYEIYESADNVQAHGSRIGLITGTHYVRPGLNLADTRYYWIRAQDTSGNFSAYLGPVSATTLGIDSADITGQIVGAQIAANTLAASNLISGLDVIQVVASIGSANPATSNVAYETGSATLFRWNGSAWTSAVGAGDIPAGAIDITKFASGITPVQVVSTLPGTASEGQTALLTTDGQLYRYHSGAWTVAVPAVNVTGTLVDTQIATVSAPKITGTLTDAQLAALSATKIIGTIADTQIATISAPKITGTLDDAQIAALNATKITGTLTDAQIAALSAAKLTGTITTTQITPGAVTTPLLAAGAVETANLAAGAITASKLAIGDTTSLVSDPYFADPSYWTLFNGAYYEGNPAALGPMGVSGAVTIATGAIPANSTAGYGVETTSLFAVQPDTPYVLQGLIWAYSPSNKPVTIQVNWFDRTRTLISAPGIGANAGAPYTNVGGAVMSGIFTSPANAAYAQIAYYVYGGGSGSPAGNSGLWIGSAFRLQSAVTTTTIQDGAISTNKIAANAVTAGQIAAGTITAAQITTGTITSTQIAANTITASQIQAGTITATELAANSVTAGKIAAGSITAGDIAANAITAGQIAANTISAGQIAANAITAAQIQAGTITANELAANSVTASKIAAGSVTATSIAANSITSAQIAANTITASNIAANAITSAQIAAGTIQANNIAAGTITSAQIAANTITAGQIQAGAIGTAQLAAQAITASKVFIGDTTNLILDPQFQDPSYWTLFGAAYYQGIASGNYVNCATYVVINEAGVGGAGNNGVIGPGISVTANQQYNFSVSVCSIGGVPTNDIVCQITYLDASHAYLSSVGTTLHGDGSGTIETLSLNFTPPANAAYAQPAAYFYATGAGTGYWCVGNPVLVRRLTGSLIVDGTITGTQIAANTITAGQIQAGTITASQIAAGTITAAQIEAAGITGDRIAAGTLTASNIAALTITAGQLAAGTITGDKINANFFNGSVFTAAPGGAGTNPQISMNGTVVTSSGLNYGPYLSVVDAGGTLRAIVGQWDSKYGIFGWDASGTPFFEDDGIATDAIGTDSIRANNVTYPYGASMTPGNFVLWSHTADVTGVLSFAASVSVYHAGGAMGSPPGRLRLYINGSMIIGADAPGTFTTNVAVQLGYSVAVNAGDGILIRWEETNASTTDTSGGSLFAVILQK